MRVDERLDLLIWRTGLAHAVGERAVSVDALLTDLWRKITSVQFDEPGKPVAASDGGLAAEAVAGVAAVEAAAVAVEGAAVTEITGLQKTTA